MTSAGAERRSPWKALVRWAFIGIAALVFWNTLRHAELGRAASLVGSIGAPIALVVLPYLVAMVLQTIGYARLIGVLRGKTPSLPRLLSVLLSSEAVLKSFPAGVALADTINPYLLKRRCGVPLPEGLAAVAAKKALIVLSNALYIGIAVVVGASWLRSSSRALIGFGGLEWLVALGGVGMLIGALAMCWAIFSGSVATRSHGLLQRIPSKRLRAWLEEKEHGFRETDRHFTALVSRNTLGFSTLAFLASWIVEAVEALVILRLLGVDMPFAEVLAFEVVIVFLRSLAFMIPAGLGVQDAGYVAFFAAFGVPDAATLGVAFVLIKRAKELFWIAAGFLLFLLLGDMPASTTAEPVPVEQA
jgi:uncharacterized protein (TIRG00374 family)